ncbi:MAG: diguanylate cyclase [Gammaproteobacteria bacterium]|nr:diguanylate cyclase [Gammaproteobacteria bacterium]
MTRPEPSAVSTPQRGWTLQREFTRLLILAGLLPALLLTAVVLWNDARSQRKQLNIRMGTVAQSSASAIDELLATHLAALTMVAERRSATGNLDHIPEWSAELARLRKYSSAFNTVLVSDAAGNVRASVPVGPADMTVADRAYFLQPSRDGRSYVSDVFLGRVFGDVPIIALSAPLTDSQAFDGVVEGSILVETFASIRSEELHQHGFKLLLLDRSWNVIYASDGLTFASLQPLRDAPAAAAIRTLPAFSAINANLIAGVLADGEDSYAVQVPLDVGWRLMLLAPEGLLAGELQRRALALLGLLVLTVMAGMAASWRQMRLLNVSLGELLEKLQRFAFDQASPPVAPDSLPRELAPLADSLNALSARLGLAYREVSEGLQEQRRLRESLEVALGDRERDIAERTEELRSAMAELDRLTRTDALTGALNYRGFHETAIVLCQQARANGRPLSALSLDIDRFKAYNDRYGHQAGDSALQRFTGAVRSALYHADDILARPGGEEFMVLLPDTPLEQSLQVAERVRASVRHAGIPHADSPHGVLTVSIGVAALEPDHGDDPGAMLAQADAALYRAKRAGRDRVST